MQNTVILCLFKQCLTFCCHEVEIWNKPFSCDILFVFIHLYFHGICVDIYILRDNEETSSKTKPASNLLLFLTQISSSYISLHTWHDHRGFIFLIFLCLDLDTWNWCFASLERTCRFSCSFCSKCSSSGVETLLKEQTPSKLVVQGAKQWVVGGTGVER